MSPDKQRIAIATACGWKRHVDGLGYYQGVHPALMGGRAIPDYLNDLNAMHKAEETLQESQRGTYSDELYDLAVEHQLKTGKWRYLSMTASQRAEAFLRTIGKWEDAK